MFVKSTIFAIPGFLGLAKDWDFLKPQFNVFGVNWHDISWNSLSDWGKGFNKWAHTQSRDCSILMGYSLGGRLALHALYENPNQWKKAIIISSHPGLETSEEKFSRYSQDLQWADRFKNEEWDSLMKAWNGQEIFSQDPIIFKRKEEDYPREQLVKAFLQRSLGLQKNLRQQIFDLKIPLLWVTGSNDKKYSEIAERLVFSHPESRHIKIPSAGHRVPWSQPEIFTSLLQQFLGG